MLLRISARSLVLIAVVASAVAGATGAVGGSTGARAGETLAFEGTHWTKNLQPGGQQLYAVRADGSGLRRLSRVGPWSDSHPAWSHDGRKLAFGRAAPTVWRLYVMDAGGSRAHAITKGYALADAPSWSPDGRSIAFAALPLHIWNGSQQVYVAATNGSGARRLVALEGGTGMPAWSPDGKRILFWGKRSGAERALTSIWSVWPNGSHLYRLIAGGTDPAWSPDGRKIAFVRGGDVYTARPDGRGVRRLTHMRTEVDRPSWSPDGTRIAFSAVHRAKNQAYDTQRVWIVNASGGGLHAITAAKPRFWTGAPAWQPAPG